MKTMADLIEAWTAAYREDARNAISETEPPYFRRDVKESDALLDRLIRDLETTGPVVHSGIAYQAKNGRCRATVQTAYDPDGRFADQVPIPPTESPKTESWRDWPPLL